MNGNNNAVEEGWMLHVMNAEIRSLLTGIEGWTLVIESARITSWLFYSSLAIVDMIYFKTLSILIALQNLDF